MPTDQAASLTLAASRRAYQLLRDLELNQHENAGRLLINVQTTDEWIALGSALKAIQSATAKQLGPEGQERCALAQAALQERLEATNGESVALADWIFTSARLALVLKRATEPDQAVRLAFYESRARTVFEGEEPGSHLRRNLQEPSE